MLKFLYFEVNLFCILVLIIILVNAHTKKKSSESTQWFRRMIITLIALCFLDALSWCFDGVDGTFARVMEIGGNVLGYCLSSSISLVSLCYLVTRFYHPISKRYLAIASIPCAIVWILSFLSIFWNVIFYVDSDNVYHRGDFFYVQLFVSFGYLFAGLLSVVIRNYKSKISLEGREYFFVSSLFWLPIVAVICQLFSFGITLIWPTTTLTILLLYINISRGQYDIDYLTQVFSKGNYEKKAEYLIAHRTNVSLIIIDVDNFKSVNDTYGHKHGDLLLSLTAKYAKEIFNESAYIGRIGGDEFSIIVIDTPDDVIEGKANQFLQRVHNMFNHVAKLYFSCSIGIAKKMETDSYGTLYQKADRALYVSKKQGRDRITIYSPEAFLEDSKQSILIVDDDIVNRVILTSCLEREYNIVEAEDGVRAVEIIKRYSDNLNLIILDIFMPQMDGYGVLDQLKKLKLSNKIKVVIISCEEVPEEIMTKYNIKGFILKPFAPIDALNTISGCLKKNKKDIKN